jgi:hypothetical protein
MNDTIRHDTNDTNDTHLDAVRTAIDVVAKEQHVRRTEVDAERLFETSGWGITS